MKDKIFQFLKTNIGSFAGGIPDNYLLGIAEAYSKTITEETQIATSLTDGALESIKQSYTFIQAESDKKAKAEVKSFREKHGLGEDGLPLDKSKGKDRDKPKTKDVAGDDDQPDLLSAIRAEIAELKTTIEEQKKEKARMSLTEKVKSHEKLKGIPASFLNGRNLIPESEDKLDQLAASIEADYSAFKQDMAEQGVNIAVPPAGGGATKEGAALGKAIAEKKNTNSSDGVKGKTI